MSETCIGKNSLHGELEREADMIVVKNGKCYYYKNRDGGNQELLGALPAIMGFQAKQQLKELTNEDIFNLNRSMDDYYYLPNHKPFAYIYGEDGAEGGYDDLTDVFISFIKQFDLPERIKDDYVRRFNMYNNILCSSKEDDMLYKIASTKVCELEERMIEYLDMAHIHDILVDFGLLKGATKQQIYNFGDLKHESRKYLKALRHSANN